MCIRDSNVIMDVSGTRPTPHGVSAEERQVVNRRREEADGVLRIFGLAPDTQGDKEARRERE